MTKTVLVMAATTGYQTRAFEAAARALGVSLVYATDRCDQLDDPWRDGAIPVDFRHEEAAVEAIGASVQRQPLGGVIATGDRPARIAARAARALGLPFHEPDGVRAAVNKLATRGRLLAGGLAVPWFVRLSIDEDLGRVADRLRFPAVVKPLALSASRGVIRADDPVALENALARVRAILRSPDVRAQADPAHDDILIEGFIPGRELALEGVMEAGQLRVFAIFDKPEPLDGPFFEETIYVTPPNLTDAERRVIAGTIAHAAHALGLHHGPVHAECRVNEAGVFVLEVAPRPIGGLCADVLRFESASARGVTLEDLLLRHAVGESLEGFGREVAAAGVMMIPIPRPGRLRHVEGLDEAQSVAGVVRVVVTARADQLLVPLPEGSGYLGFIFARGEDPEAVIAALARRARAR